MLGTPELRQGRAGPGRPRRARGQRRAIPRTSRWGSASGDRRSAPRRPAARRARSSPSPSAVGATEAEVARHGRRLGADPVRQQRDPPERRRAEPSVNLRFVDGRRIGVRLDQPGRRRGRCGASPSAPPASRDSSPSRRTGRPARAAARSRAVAGAIAEATAERDPGVPRRGGARAVIAAADAVGVMAYGSFSTDARAVAVANSPRHRGAGGADLGAAPHGPHGPDGEARLRRAARMDATTIDAAAVGREAADEGARAATARWPSSPATTRSCSRSTRSSTSSTCSATSASPRSPSRRSARSPSRAEAIGSELVTIVDDAPTRPACRRRSTTRASRKQRVTLLERGVCRDVVYDSQTAARAGRARPATACRRRTRGVRSR